jgi:tetratricopeptide (TPR) repeat protein
VPNLANVFGVETSLWLMLPVIVAIVICVAIVGRSMRLRVQFVAGLVLGIVAVTTYLSWPGLDSDEDAFRRATIAERYFRPGDRLNAVNERAVQSRDWTTLRRVNNYEWNIADTRAYAPNDFPYLKVQPLGPSPSKILRQALEMQNRGDANGAEKLLTNAKSVFPFANCEFATSLAVIYYTTNRKDAALRDLEAIQPLVNPASLPQCARSQYFLGSLYKEMSRSDDAENAFRQFISNTDGSTDPEIVGFRKSLKSPQ